MPDAITIRDSELSTFMQAVDNLRDLAQELMLDYDEIILVPTDSEEYFLPRLSGYPLKNAGAARPNAR